MAQNKSNTLMVVLVLIVVVLALALVYLLALKPAITGYAVNAQNQGVQAAVLSIMQRAAQCQTVPLTYGNQTINVVSVECVNQALQGQQAQQQPQSQQIQQP